MIEAVSVVEEFLKTNAVVDTPPLHVEKEIDLDKLKSLIEKTKEHEICLHVNQSALALSYSSQENLSTFATRGVLAPEHIIRTKRVPLIIEDESLEDSIEKFIVEYKNYFAEFSKDEICLNPTPNYAVIKGFGVVTFGKNKKEACIINDIIEHTMLAVLRADQLSGFNGISLKECFEMEY